MTNLSDLLPAGAASKQLSFTASGAVASGKPVALNSNGTVSQVAESSPTFGSADIFDTDTVYSIATVYDPVNDRVIAFYDDGTSNEGNYSVGVVSGTSITWSTPGNWLGSRPNSLSPVYDVANSRVVMVYRDSSGNPQAIVGYISNVGSGTMTFGSATQINGSNSRQPVACYDSDTQKVIVTYGDTGNSTYGTSKVGTVSGESISFGSAVVFNSSATYPNGAVYHTGIDRTIFTYNDTGSSQIKAVVASISGTTPSFSGNASFHSGNNTLYATNNFNQLAYDTTANRVVFTARDSNGQFAYAGEAATSGITWGSKATIKATAGSYSSIAFNVSAGVTTVFYTDVSPNMYGLANDLTISGSTITPSGTNTSYSDFTLNRVFAIYDPDSTKSIVVFTDNDTNTDGQSKTYSPLSTNASSFLGIADAAISNAASGKITMKGGVVTNSQLLPFAYTGSLGSAAVYQSTATEYQGIAFDSSNNKIVVAYKDDSNQHGTCAVGTVSGTSISWGTPVVFAAASTSYVDVTFDSSNNKVVIVYSDVANSEYGTAIVGTVSGTSISFGSEVVFASAATTFIGATFDSNSNKVVAGYRDDGNSQYLTTIVGTVSGTSISFGTEVVVDSTGSLSGAFGGFVFDSTNNKVVIPYSIAGGATYGIVGTVSGTSISFGTRVAIGSVSGQNLSVAFDSNAGKVVINYRDANNSDYTGSVVGTVSGTSISFGTELVIEEVHNLGATTFDSSDNKIIFFYKSSSLGYYRIGTVSGTSISYGSAVSLISNNLAYMAATFDSNQNTSVVVYKDSGNSNYGTAKGLQVSGAYPNLVPNTTYYVQNDGTLSTTSSTVTAGKAMSTNSINLDYST